MHKILYFVAYQIKQPNILDVHKMFPVSCTVIVQWLLHGMGKCILKTFFLFRLP